MNFNQLIQAGSNTLAAYASSIPGTSGTSAPVSQERFLGFSSAGTAGVGLGTIIAGYVIGRYLGIVPKII